MDAILSNMFHLAVPLLEKIIRPALVYIFLIVALRIAGKRELAQLNSFDLVVLMLLSNTVQNAILGEDSSVTGGVIGAATLLGINHLVVRFMFKHEKVERLVEGEPTPLIEEGKAIEENLDREAITQNELDKAARRQGFSSLQEIEEAELDPSGSISFTGREPGTASRQHDELLQRLDQISRELAELKRANNR